MRKVFPSPAFDRMVETFLKRNSAYEAKIAKTIDLLKKDCFHSLLKTHKLHGGLKNFYACFVGYDQRIIFKIVNNEIILLAFGSHDKLY